MLEVQQRGSLDDPRMIGLVLRCRRFVDVWLAGQGYTITLLNGRVDAYFKRVDAE